MRKLFLHLSLLLFATNAAAQQPQSQAQMGVDRTGPCPRVTVYAPTQPGADKTVSILCVDTSTNRPRPPRYQGNTFGQEDTAAILSVIGNAPYDQPAQVFGGVDPVSVTPSRDAVTIYAEMTNPPVYMAIPAASYTATSFIPATPLTAAQRAKLKVGMIVDTSTLTNKYGGFITGWAANGSSVSVRRWSTANNPADGQVPPAGGTAYFNSQLKGWVANFNSFIRADSQGPDSAVIESGIINQLADSDPFNIAAPVTWGYDVVNLGPKRTGVGMLVRGQAPGFHTGYFAENTTYAGFYISKDGANFPTTGFLSAQTAGAPFAFSPGLLGTKFAVGQDGSIVNGNDAVENGWQLTVTASGAAAYMGPRGKDAVINTMYRAKGPTAQTELGGEGGLGSAPFRVIAVANPSNRVEVNGSIAGQAVKLFSRGGDATVNFAIGTKGLGVIGLGALTDVGNEVVRIIPTANQVNRLQFLGGATGGAATIAADGADAAVDLVLQAKAATIATGSVVRPTADAAIDIGLSNFRYRNVYSSGAAFRGIVTVSSGSSYTATTANDIIVIRKATGSATTVNLPLGQTVGHQIIIVDGKGDAATNPITISGGTKNINGATTLVLGTARASARLVYDGTEWVGI